MPISCVYCGGADTRADEVRECWARSERGEAAVSSAAAQPQMFDEQPPRLVRTEPGSSGPDALGRNLVIRPGDSIPEQWTTSQRIVVDHSVLAGPGATVERLRSAAHRRERVVIELNVELTYGQTDTRPLHEIGPRGELLLDELHHLVWSNADVADTGDAWVDGGPLRFFEPIDGRPVVHRIAIEHGSWEPFGSNTSDATLAPDQLAAVTARSGVARIIAPAGSGKTRVLTERARHLVRQWKLPASAITMVAYNRRAQLEMESRLADVPGVQVRTLNSIALAIINGSRPFASQSTRWQTLNELDVRRILGELVSSPRRRNVDPLAPWLEALSAVRLGLRHADDVEDLYDGDVSGLAQVLPQYEAELERRSAVDFDGQITRAIRLLLTDPRSRAAAQHACRVLLVDEFQDMTPAHVLLVRLLAAPAGAVFGVGDDDQTIYGYNGADPAWLIDYGALFPAAEDHPLEVNYRCPADVVECVERMLRRNHRRVPKTIRAAKLGTSGLELAASADPVATTVEAIRALPPKDVAILTRVNALLVPVQVALASAGIGCTRASGTEFLTRTPVRAGLAWLRLATAPAARLDTADLAEAIRRPSRSLSPRVAAWVAEQRSMAALHKLAGRIEGKDSTAVAAFVADLELARTTAAKGTTDDLLSEVFDDFGLAGTLASFDLNRRGTNTSAQSDDLLALRQLALQQPDPAAFPGWLRDQLDRPTDPDGVTLATVHRVKGQEWPFVVVHLADKDQFPHRLAEDLEEERRLFHVALTRTSGRVLVVTSGRTSPFVRELSEEPSERDAVETPPPAARQATRPAPVAATRSAEAEKVFAALREMRQRVRNGKPAYTVFADATLDAIAQAKPTTLDALARIKGVGPAKLEQYGDAVLDVVNTALGD